MFNLKSTKYHGGERSSCNGPKCPSVEKLGFDVDVSVGVVASGGTKYFSKNATEGCPENRLKIKAAKVALAAWLVALWNFPASLNKAERPSYVEP